MFLNSAVHPRHSSSQPEVSQSAIRVTLQALSVPLEQRQSPSIALQSFRCRLKRFLFSLHFELLVLHGLARFLLFSVFNVFLVYSSLTLYWMCRSSVCSMCSSRSAFGFSQVFLFFFCLCACPPHLFFCLFCSPEIGPLSIVVHRPSSFFYFVLAFGNLALPLLFFWSPLALGRGAFSVLCLNSLAAHRDLSHLSRTSPLASGAVLQRHFVVVFDSVVRFWPPPTPLLSIAPLRDCWFAVGALAPQESSLQQRGLLSVRIGFSFARYFSLTVLKMHLKYLIVR